MYQNNTIVNCVNMGHNLCFVSHDKMRQFLHSPKYNLLKATRQKLANFDVQISGSNRLGTRESGQRGPGRQKHREPAHSTV